MLNSSYDLVFQKRLGLVSALAAFLGLFAACSLLVQDRWWSNFWSDVFWSASSSACAWRCFRTSRAIAVPSLARAWFLFGLGASCWALGMVWWSWRQLVNEIVIPFPEISAIAFLAIVPFFLAGLFHYGWEQPRRDLTFLHLAELGVSLCLIGIVSVTLFYRPVANFQGSLLYLGTALAYPVLYFSTLIFASLRFWNPWPVNKLPFSLFLLGVASLTGVNIAYAYSLLSYLYLPGRLFDLFWALGFCLVYWAAFEEEIGVNLRVPRRVEKLLRPNLVRALLPGIALLCVVASTFTYHSGLDSMNRVYLNLCVVLAVFLGFREWFYQSVQFDLSRGLKEEWMKTDAILKQMPSGLLIADHAGNILRYNDSANRIFHGRLAHISSLKEYNEVVRGFHADGRELVHDEWPLSRSIKNGEVVVSDEIDIVTGHGDRATVLISSTPIFAGDGTVSCCVASFVDVSEKKRLELERDNLFREAKSLASMRENFLMVASHELKTPLTPLKLRLQYFDQLIRRKKIGEVSPELLERNMASAIEQIRRLEALVRDMLNISEIDAGRIALFPAATDLVALAGEVIQRFQAEFRSRQCELAGPPPGKVFAWIDRQRTEQVISILLSNALKYGAGRPVELNVWEEGGRAKLSVKDSGIGIASADQERIFQRFERAASTSHYGGFGLGLFIARAIVEAEGGLIRVQSEPGHGSAFVIDLPLVAEKPSLGETAS
jgi:signal transduction histidine kinase